MKVRKIKEGEVLFGRGRDAFLENTPEAVAQSVMTRLRLWRGTWWFDTEEGTPWLDGALGHHSVIDTILRDRVLDTEGVVSILEMDYIESSDTRRIMVSMVLETVYGQTSLEAQL